MVIQTILSAAIAVNVRGTAIVLNAQIVMNKQQTIHVQFALMVLVVVNAHIVTHVIHVLKVHATDVVDATAIAHAICVMVVTMSNQYLDGVQIVAPALIAAVVTAVAMMVNLHLVSNFVR